jgi:hypothetical protein
VVPVSRRIGVSVALFAGVMPGGCSDLLVEPLPAVRPSPGESSPSVAAISATEDVAVEVVEPGGPESEVDELDGFVCVEPTPAVMAQLETFTMPLRASTWTTDDVAVVFFAKVITQVKSGGLLPFTITTETLDSVKIGYS